MTPSPAEIQGWLVGRVSVLAEVPPADVDVRLPLMYYGLDSASLITLTADLEQWLGHRFRENPLDAHPTIESLSRFLAEQVVRSVLDDQPGSELLRPAVAAAPGRVSDFLLVVLQLALILAIVYRFDLAAQNHLFPSCAWPPADFSSTLGCRPASACRSSSCCRSAVSSFTSAGRTAPG